MFLVFQVYKQAIFPRYIKLPGGNKRFFLCQVSMFFSQMLIEHDLINRSWDVDDVEL